MTKISRTGTPWFRSDNLKSKIENRKLVGIFAIALIFAFGGAVVNAQQTSKVPRIGKHCFWYGRTLGGVSARAEQAWMD
jgi:hypothetical protein